MKSILKPISLLGQFWHDQLNARLLRWNLVFIVIQIALLIIYYPQLPPVIPMFFSQPWGQMQLGSYSNLFYFPVVSIIILLVNNLLSAVYLGSSLLFSRLLVMSSILFAFLSLYSLFQIIILAL
ncbi:MAG TPA: hypothetical protein PK370_00775 [Candidatus Woesebacteria bacterium]|nr:hypothetical protein [Candidatus Woesebacteria bacterium]HPJ17445.1 hypothetical protein [Candidatus Woesebacteria bacterium]